MGRAEVVLLSFGCVTHWYVRENRRLLTVNGGRMLYSTSTLPHTTFAKATAVEERYGVQVCDATEASCIFFRLAHNHFLLFFR